MKVSGPEEAAGVRMYDPRQVDLGHSWLGAAFGRAMASGAKKSPYEFMQLLEEGPGRVASPRHARRLGSVSMDVVARDLEAQTLDSLWQSDGHCICTQTRTLHWALFVV